MLAKKNPKPFVDSVATPEHCLRHLLDPPSVLMTFLMVYGQLSIREKGEI